MNSWIEDFKKHFKELNIRENEPMSKHSTFHIGGPADLYVEPEIEQAGDVISYCMDNDIPITILGNGSNILVGDKGIRGVVLSFGSAASKIKIDGNIIIAEAGAMLAKVANEAANNSLSGLEFAAGIPGTVGGAMLMNAGAYGGEMKDVVKSVTVMNYEGDVEMWQEDELDLSYRHSRMMDEDVIILSAVFELKPGDQQEIRDVMADYRGRRQDKQPLEYSSAGSTFKRPQGYFAGKLIMDAGLAGYSVGDAQVSEKHCGFVINKGGASAAEVCKLMDDVAEVVHDKYGVKLEPEVRKIGEF
ncbi:MAG: UDP-N-acetylmuramate dehydrogenase [Lachnospiraceae bacterium]|nr:UDP-N-acetylmuramate dehydrogenase [Lachnospiraceae bacterium]